MNPDHLEALSATTALLYQKSVGYFWMALPVALLLSLLILYVTGEMTGGKLESLFRRLLIAIALIAAFPQISHAIRGLESNLVDTFGGEQALLDVFSKLGERAGNLKQDGTLSWLKVGQMGLNIITTLSFLILALVRHFLDMLHLSLWNLLQVLAPLSLLGCLFQSWAQVPKGVFMGLFEISLWKPIWVIMARLLIATGFGSEPKDVSEWFDTAVLNFTVAGLMASTPMLVHSYLSGALASMGGSVMQTMASGVGAVLTAQPMRVIQSSANWASSTTSTQARKIFSGTRSRSHTSEQPRYPTHKK
jgi:hypothetical protein